MRVSVVLEKGRRIDDVPWLRVLGRRWELTQHHSASGSWVRRRFGNVIEIVKGLVRDPRAVRALWGRTRGSGFGRFARCVPLACDDADFLYFPSTSVALAFLEVLAMRPTIVSAHLDRPRNPYEWEPEVFRRAGVVHCACEADAREIVAMGVPEERVIVAFAGVEVVPLAIAAAADGTHLLWTQRLDWRACVDESLVALRKVTDAGCDVRLVLTAKGPGRPRVVLAAQQLGVAGRVEMHDGDVALVGRPSAVVHLDLLSGLDDRALSAIAAGIPVICHGESTGAELLRVDSEICEVSLGDTEGVADRIVRLASDPELARKVGERARDRLTEALDDCRQAEVFARAVETKVDRSPEASLGTEIANV